MLSEKELVDKFKEFFAGWKDDMIAFETENGVLTVHLTRDRHYRFSCDENRVSLESFKP